MTKPKRKNTNRTTRSMLKEDDSNSSILSEVNSLTMDNNQMKFAIWKAEVKDTMRSACKKINNLQKARISVLDFEFETSLLAIPNDVLNTVIDIDSENFRDFLQIKKGDSEESPDKRSSSVAPTTLKRRSRSAANLNLTKSTSVRKSKRLRSSSVDIYKTPKVTGNLASILSSKKYTVSKPRRTENSGVHVKRIMKPDEEAISTCGSPLYVGSCALGAPHVNIPLPGGVVLNIEAKTPKGEVEIPGLDQKTKCQIKLLCDQLKKLC